MTTVFLGERSPSMNGSRWTGASTTNAGASSNYLQTPPPDDYQFPEMRNSTDSDTATDQKSKFDKFNTVAWLEIWDYLGGASFRAFVSDNGQEKSLFVFFDIDGVMGRDLKKA